MLKSTLRACLIETNLRLRTVQTCILCPAIGLLWPGRLRNVVHGVARRLKLCAARHTSGHTAVTWLTLLTAREVSGTVTAACVGTVSVC